MGGLVEEEALKKWAKCPQRARLLRWLKENHIPFFIDGQKGACTTQAAIDYALMGHPQEEISFK